MNDPLLVLVDENDMAIGQASKTECHTGAGLLHRAFSVFLFNDQSALLIQKRSALKPLWPGVWANSCCSHPGPDEPVADAARARTQHELGLSVALRFIYKFRYQASCGDVGSEHELCWVLVGQAHAEPEPHADEVQATRWVSPEELDVLMRKTPADFAPWFRMEWAALRGEHWASVREGS